MWGRTVTNSGPMQWLIRLQVVKHLRNVRVLLVVLVMSFLIACMKSQDGAVRCCTGVSASDELTEVVVTEGVEDGEIVVRRRFDRRTVTITLWGQDAKTRYLYSADGGETWRRDVIIEDIANRIVAVRQAQIIPWEPTCNESVVKYRTVFRDEDTPTKERSTDGGRTWTAMKSLVVGCKGTLKWSGPDGYHPLNALILYASGHTPESDRTGMYVSADGGDSFTLMYVSAGLPRIAISESDPRVMYGSGLHGLVKSGDGGNVWEVVGQNDLLRNTRVRTRKRETPGEGRHEWPTDVYAIAIDTKSAEHVYVATSKGLLRSENGGRTWCVVNTGMPQARAIRSVAVLPDVQATLLVGTYRGLMRSTDGGCHWEWLEPLAHIVK
jgi:hypothetical protein